MSAVVIHSRRASRVWPIAAVVVAGLLRAAALEMGSGHLADDRDDYLLVARHYAADGFWTPFVGIPSSFRPPLFPLVFAAILKAGGGSFVLGLGQLVLGTATVALTWRIGRRLGLGSFALIAAGLVAVDPLLIEYTTFPMTETLFTFLVTLLVWISIPNSAPDAGFAIWKAAVAGALFGACALCRPTIWPAAPLVAAWLVCRPRTARGPVKAFLRNAAVALLAAAVVVSPWVVRNAKILGSPVLTTTHGGYTLLLGNNEAFFRQVAARPFLEEWQDREPDRFQRQWFADLVAQMDRQIGPAAGELAQDRWMYDRAWQAISASPRLFLRACLLRFAEFWNVMPLSPSRTTVSAILVGSLAAGYAIELALFIAGLVSLFRRGIGDWGVPLLLVLNFTLVHLFYWSNMRMRAPLVPLIALVAARGVGAIWSSIGPARRGRSPLPGECGI